MAEQVPKLSEMPMNKRIPYIWEYYKWHILITLLIIFGVVSLIVHFATDKEDVLNGIFINTPSYNDEAVFEDWLTSEGYSLEKFEVAVNSGFNVNMTNEAVDNSQTIASITMLIATGTNSFYFSDAATHAYFVECGIFPDLRNYVSTETLNAYEGDIIYGIDPATNESYPCGIHLTKENNAWVRNYGYYDECYFSFTNCDSDLTLQQSFAEYLLQK